MATHQVEEKRTLGADRAELPVVILRVGELFEIVVVDHGGRVSRRWSNARARNP
jgi:hypothetical protein